VLKNNLNSILFALAMCLVCSVLLSGAAAILKDKQQANVELDIKKNILKALMVSDQPLNSPEEVLTYYQTLDPVKTASLYSENIKEMVVTKQGDVLQGKTPAQLTDKDSDLPVYIKVSGDKPEAYCIPIQGKGLWSTIKGYLAFKDDLNTILGVTFYEQGETAGLGAEVAESWFQELWKNKKILSDDGTLKSITIAKGKVSESDAMAIHKVDGISGSTITGNGINSFLKKGLNDYSAYFNKARVQ
jgi:Na+-transporting NADH:ubiquinone oxidoreductase subunit C